MAFQINEYLRQQSIRLQREDWKQNAQLLGDEIYTIMSNIQLLPAPQTATDDNGNPINVPDPIPLPPIISDPGGNAPGPGGTDPIVDPTNPPQVDPPVVTPPGGGGGGDGGNTQTQTVWVRSTHPGKITSGSSGGSSFSCDLYYNGLNESPSSRTATVTDPASASAVYEGLWVTIFFIAKYEVTTVASSPGSLRLISQEHLFNAPSGGGAWGTSHGITGKGEGDTPGTGSVTLQKLSGDSWTGGDSVNVESTVTEDTPSGRIVQVKRVSGKWFLDVEDCGDDEDGSANA